jgi:Heat shock protein. Metallo peptidase. MEROPS family M48B
MLNSLKREELKGVLGHELSHIRNRDILISTVVATIAGAVMLLADMARWAALFGGYGSRDDGENRGSGFAMLFLAIVAPLAALIIQMAISRSREYAADRGGALLTGNPAGLASALEKLQQSSVVRHMNANTATAHMFIVNPLSGRSFLSIFSTHPPIEERIKRLRAMA